MESAEGIKSNKNDQNLRNYYEWDGFKPTYEPSDSSSRVYPGFCSMKRLGVFVLPPGWVLLV